MVDINPQMPLYSIGVVEEILQIPQRILRLYEEKGVIKPTRSETNRRLYSQKDLEKIEYIHYLTHIKKVNLAGVKEIFDLLDKLREDEREKLIHSVEEEIKSMSEEKKKLFKEGKDEIISLSLPEDNDQHFA